MRVSELALPRRGEVFGRGGIVNCGATRGKFFVLSTAIDGGLVSEEISCFDEIVVSRSRTGGVSW